MPRTTRSALLGLAAALIATASFAAQAERFANGKSWYGAPSSAELATQTVNVQSVRQLNVNCGDTVTFRSGDQSFSWRFDSVQHRAVDLRQIAPAGFKAEALRIYVSANVYERS